MKATAKKAYHPAMGAAAGFWCNELENPRRGNVFSPSPVPFADVFERQKLKVTPKKIAVFKAALLDGMARTFDMFKENIIQSDASKPTGGVFASDGVTSEILLDAPEKANLSPKLLSSEITTTVSGDAVAVTRLNVVHDIFDGSVKPQVVWKAPEIHR